MLSVVTKQNIIGVYPLWTMYYPLGKFVRNLTRLTNESAVCTLSSGLPVVSGIVYGSHKHVVVYCGHLRVCGTSCFFMFRDNILLLKSILALSLDNKSVPINK